MCNLILENHKLLVEKETICIYLEHQVHPGETTKIERTGEAWATFGNLNITFRGRIPYALQRKLFNQRILHVFTYTAKNNDPNSANIGISPQEN